MYTPLELQKITFEHAAFGGYKREDVDEIFDLLIADYEQIYKENIALNDKIAVLNEVVQKYKSMEDSLQNALVMAQSTSEDMKKNAQEKAQQIVKEAELQAQSVLMKSSEEITALTVKKEEMRQSVTSFAAKLTALLNAQIDLLKELTSEV